MKSVTFCLARKDASALASEIFSCDIIALVQYKLLRESICTVFTSKIRPGPQISTGQLVHHDLKSEVATDYILPRALATCSGADKGIEVIQVGWKKPSESSGGEV